MAEIPLYIHVLRYFFFSYAVLYGIDLFSPQQFDAEYLKKTKYCFC